MKRINKHINAIVTSKAVETVLELAQAKGVDVLANKKGKVIAKKIHTELLNEVLRQPTVYITLAAKFIVASEAEKHMPLTTVMSQIGKAVKMDNKVGFRLGAVVLNLMKQAGIFVEYMKHTENGFEERVIKLSKKWMIDEDMLKELLLHVSPGAKPFQAKDWTVKPDGTLDKGGYSKTKAISGSSLNEVIIQTQALYDVLNYKQSIKYRVDWDVFNKFEYYFQDSFPAEESMSEIRKMRAELEILGDKAAYFAWNFGANGRTYCQGYRTHRQAGIRNEVFDFYNTTKWSQEDFHIVQRQIDDLRGDKSAKAQIQLYKLERDLAAQLRGEETGTIIKRDAKMSGVQQVGAIMMRSKLDALHTGLLSEYKGDGRLILAAKGSMAKYGLDKPQAKAAAMTWMYLSGGQSMVNKVLADTERDLNVDGKTFKKEWDEAAKDVFPGQVKFMHEAMGIIKYMKNNTHFRFTSSSGFKVSIAAIGTVEDSIDTVMGRHNFSRQEIDKEFMGVKLGAAAGHSEDAASDHMQTWAAKDCNCDIDTVFDQFGFHLGNSEWGDNIYMANLRWKLEQPLLQSFFESVANNGARANHVLINTLKVEDIQGGLFD